MFSKQVIVDIVSMFPGYHTNLDTYLLKFDLDNKINFDASDSIDKKKLKITKFLIANQEVKDNFKNNIVLNVVEDRIINHLLDDYRWDSDMTSPEFKSFPKLYKYLRFDGYDIDFECKKLVRMLPDDIGAAQKEDNIISVLIKFGFNTTKGHFEQAKASYLGGSYAALNSQLRTFTESLFMEMAQYVKNLESENQDISNISIVNATTAMQVLAKCAKPILDRSLNEWDGQNTGYIQGFWKRLHPEGCHPGLPTIDEAVFRFQLVLLNTSNLINRLISLY